MNKLFNEISNPLFHTLCQLINEIHSGHKLTRKEIHDRINKIPAFHYNEAPETSRETAIINKVFRFSSPESPAELCLDAQVPPLITSTELSWLKSMLQESSYSFLLPTALREELLQRLKDIPPLYHPKIWKGHPDNDILFHPCLKMILEAFFHQKMLRSHQCIIAPYRLEYDLATGNYTLIAWHISEQRLIKETLDASCKFELSQEDIPPMLSKKISDYFQEHREELILRLSPTRNAVERCFSLFDTYDKKAWIEQDGTYMLTIQYYDFDREEILHKIKTLASSVTILSPDSIRQAMKEFLLQTARLYHVTY